MTLDEMIERYQNNAEYERTHGNLQGCLDFRQLAEWLKDYKRLKESSSETKIDCDNADCNNCVNHKYCDYEPNNSENPTGSTTKNNFAVDPIDRVELLKAMNTWDKFGYSTRYGLERLDKDDKSFVPYVKYDDMLKCVAGMLSVTPQPKTGHWIEHEHNGKSYIECSECLCWFLREHLLHNSHCPNCGADMRGNTKRKGNPIEGNNESYNCENWIS